MALLFQSKEKTHTLGVWEMTESLDALMKLPQLQAYLSQALEFTSTTRRQEWLTVRLLLHELLDEPKQIAYSSNGKPYLTDGSCQISISHTVGYVAVIISSEYSVSVDIEAYGDRIKRVMHRVFNPDEFFFAQDADATFYELLIWSAKEVIVKTNALKAIDFREHLCVQPFSLSKDGHFYIVEHQTPLSMMFRINYMTHKAFVLTYNLM